MAISMTAQKQEEKTAEPGQKGRRPVSHMIKYALSSLCCTGADYALYMLFVNMLPVAWSYALARVCSASLNYFLNCRVFGGRVCVRSSAGYAGLALFSMITGALLTSLVSGAGLGSVASKLAVDGCLFVFNYIVQKNLVFKRDAS